MNIELSGKLERCVDEVDRLLAGGAKSVTLDMQQVSFISVEGLEWLEEMLLHSQSLGAEVQIINIPPTIYKVFKVARIEPILKACGGSPVTPPAC